MQMDKRAATAPAINLLTAKPGVEQPVQRGQQLQAEAKKKKAALQSKNFVEPDTVLGG